MFCVQERGYIGWLGKTVDSYILDMARSPFIMSLIPRSTGQCIFMRPKEMVLMLDGDYPSRVPHCHLNEQVFT